MQLSPPRDDPYWRCPPRHTPGLLTAYLDYDGVLHRGGALRKRRGGWYPEVPGIQFFEFADLLADLLRPHPNVKIVLATAWQTWRGFNHTRTFLPRELQARVIGGTYHRRLMRESEWKESPRGLQIWSDVLRRQPKDWFAIDDDAENWPSWSRDKLVMTDEYQGIAPEVIQAAIRAKLRAIDPPAPSESSPLGDRTASGR